MTHYADLDASQKATIWIGDRAGRGLAEALGTDDPASRPRSCTGMAASSGLGSDGSG